MKRYQTSPPPMPVWRVLFLLSLVIVLVGYFGGRPAMENLVGIESGGVARKKLDDNRFETPAGLIFNQNRLEHVMRHAKDDLDRQQRHGVFDADVEDDVLKVLDSGYAKVVSNSVDVQTSREDGRDIYTIDMKKRIGYEGGKVGRQRGNPECRHLRLIIEKRHVITAFPLRQ